MSAAPRPGHIAWALQANRVGFSYAGAAPLFEAVDLAVRPREIVCLLGGSGCGKSTLLRVLAGLAPASSGEVRFLGQPVTRPDPRSALVFQQPSLLPWLNVAANVGFGLDFARQPALAGATRQQRIAEAIAAVGLAGKERLYPAALSGGMAQRVALARALARQPEMLFADEPFSALDAITRAEMQALLVDVVHRWHSAVLLVTHDIDEAMLVADRIVLMGARPGQGARLVREWRVDLPQPRAANDAVHGAEHRAALTALRLDILAALQDLRGAPAASPTERETT